MKTLKINKIKHSVKNSHKAGYIEPNINESCYLEEDGEILGFYLHDLSKYKLLTKFLAIANKEFRSDNVPKAYLDRLSTVQLSKKGIKRSVARGIGVSQMSTQLGSIPPNAVMRRPRPNLSQVHRDKKAQIFIKAMLGCCIEGEKIIKEIAPEIYKRQKELFNNVEDKWKFGNLFTSSISNYNIAADYHTDVRNMVGAVNLIYTKRNNANGGCLNVPDYDATFGMPDNSMVVYPAWRNLHGVSPIENIAEDGYRNSFIFYALKSFLNKTNETL